MYALKLIFLFPQFSWVLVGSHVNSVSYDGDVTLRNFHEAEFKVSRDPVLTVVPNTA